MIDITIKVMPMEQPDFLYPNEKFLKFWHFFRNFFSVVAPGRRDVGEVEASLVEAIKIYFGSELLKWREVLVKFWLTSGT